MLGQNNYMNGSHEKAYLSKQCRKQRFVTINCYIGSVYSHMIIDLTMSLWVL